MLEGLHSAERMQTRDEQERLTELVTVEPAPAQATFDAAQPPGRVGPQLQATLNLIPAHTWYANASGVLTFLNERGSDYIGLPKDHPLRLGIGSAGEWDSHIALLHPDDHEESRRVWSTCLSTGSAGQASFRVRNAEGGYRWFLSRAEPVRASDGTLLYWIGINLDIEDRKQAEFYLAEGQRLAHMGSWAFNAAGFDYWSPELFRIYGLQPGGKAPTKEEYIALVHPEDRHFVAETIQKMFADGRGVDFTKRIVRPDGQVRRVRCVGVPATHGGTFHGTGIDITDQEQLTEELRRSEFYLAQGQRLGHAGSWSFKPDLTCEYWSRELYEILGFDPRNGIPTISDYFTRVHPEDRPVVEATIRHMIAAGEGCDLKKRIIRPDGAQRVIRCVGMAVREQGVVARFVGTLMDITEQEELTREFRRREAYLAEAQRLSHTGSWAWSPDTDVRYWSEECFRVLGFDTRDGLPSTEELIQRIHPDDQPTFRESARRAKYKKVDEKVDYRIVHPGGAVRDIHSIGHPVLSPSGDLIEYTGTVIDITERKRAEEELRASERKYRSLVDTTPALVHTAMPNGDLDFFNRGWLEYLGLSIADLLGWRWTAVIHPEDVEEFSNKWRASLASEQPFVAESRVRRADGEYRWFLHRKQPQRNEAGVIVKWYGSSIEIEERKIAEEAIRRGEAFLAEGQRLSHTGSWGWNASTGKVTWSQEHFRILGLDPQHSNPSLDVFWERVHPDDRIGLRRAFESAIRDKRDFEREFRIFTSDRSVRHLHGVGHAILNKANELVEFIGSTMDVTEREELTQELRRREAYLAEAQRLSHTGSFGWNYGATGELIWSEETYRICGFDSSVKPTHELVRDRVHPDDRQVWQQAFDRAAEGEEVDFENRLVMPDGTVKFLHTVAYGVRKDGKYVEVVGTVMDITERKRAEETIRRSEAYLAEAQRLSKTGSFAWSPATDNTYYSEECYRVLGFEPQGATAPSFENVMQRIHPDDQARCRELVEKAIRDKVDLELDYRIVHPDKRVRDIHCVGHVVLDRSGELVEIVGTVIDITERKRAEAALQEARAELERVSRVTTMGELAASIAHEINQPLAGVVTSANAGLNWLAANPPNLSKTRETLERILRDGTRGGEVLARIRALLKRTPPAKTLVSVNQIVRDVLALTAGELRQHQIELSLDLASTIPAVRGDTVQLQQVLLNLIKNAIEAMAGIANGQRTLRIQSRLGELEGKPAVTIEVSDTGVGFSGSDSLRLFEAFHTTKPQGMGMGLWISRSIIESHHGRLTASPKNGPGATFVIMLPKASQEQA